jgi:predicted nucleic acid-binding protein
LKSADVDLALVQVGQLLNQAVELSTEFVSMSQAFAQARRFRLSAYDAVYLEVAQRLRVPFATLDRSLAAAAKLANVDLFR